MHVSLMHKKSKKEEFQKKKWSNEINTLYLKREKI